MKQTVIHLHIFPCNNNHNRDHMMTKARLVSFPFSFLVKTLVVLKQENLCAGESDDTAFFHANKSNKQGALLSLVGSLMKLVASE